MFLTELRISKANKFQFLFNIILLIEIELTLSLNPIHQGISDFLSKRFYHMIMKPDHDSILNYILLFANIAIHNKIIFLRVIYFSSLLNFCKRLIANRMQNSP